MYSMCVCFVVLCVLLCCVVCFVVWYGVFYCVVYIFFCVVCVLLTNKFKFYAVSASARSSSELLGPPLYTVLFWLGSALRACSVLLSSARPSSVLFTCHLFSSEYLLVQSINTLIHILDVKKVYASYQSLVVAVK